MKQKENGWWKKDFRSQFPGLMYTIISEGEDDGEICSGEEYVEYFISQVEQDARKDERERAKDVILDVIQETDWIEEPRSAFGRLNEALKGLSDNNE